MNNGHFERSWIAGTLIWVHADGTREVYFEGCTCCDNGPAHFPEEDGDT